MPELHHLVSLVTDHIFPPVSLFPILKWKGKNFKNIFLPFLEKKKLDAYEMQKTKKELLHFFGERHVAEDGYFRTICCLSLWKGIGYVFQLFPFCASLGEPSRSLPARGAGAETDRSGTPNLGTQGR